MTGATKCEAVESKPDSTPGSSKSASSNAPVLSPLVTAQVPTTPPLLESASSRGDPGSTECFGSLSHNEGDLRGSHSVGLNTPVGSRSRGLGEDDGGRTACPNGNGVFKRTKTDNEGRAGGDGADTPARASPPAVSPPLESTMSLDNLEELFRNATLLEKRNKYKHALDIFDQILRIQQNNSRAWNGKGTCLRALGRLEEGHRSILQALEYNPDDPAAFKKLGDILKESNRLEEAVDAYIKALVVDPFYHEGKVALAVVITDLGTVLKNAGNSHDAMAKYNEALQYHPDYAAAYYNIGVILAEMGRYEEALRAYNTALEKEPRFTEAYCNIGVIYKNMMRLDLAEQYYERALVIAPNFTIAKNNLAVVLNDKGAALKNDGFVNGAVVCYKRALVMNSQYPDAYYNLGVVHAERMELDEAIINYELAVHFNPHHAQALNNLGVVYKDRGNLDKSKQCYELALAVQPRFAQTLNNMGVLHTVLGMCDQARYYCQKAIEANPQYSDAYNNLGVLLRDEGDIPGALAAYNKCISITPGARFASQNRLLSLNYLHGQSVSSVYQEHVQWGEEFQKIYPVNTKYAPRAPASKAPLRVGYISGDLFTHSVSYFIHAPLQYHNADAVEVFCYSNVAREDEKTALLKSYGRHWRNIYGLSTDDAADMIYDDRIDILVELSGHTAGNRLDIMARKPAPILVTWIGYPNTTGLKTIDYRITDGAADPVDSEQEYTEELVRMKDTFLCYTPPSEVGAVDLLPAVENGFVTFGTFNNLAKITTQAIALWSRILKAVARSRIMIKSKAFASDNVQAKVLAQFEIHGISSSRVDLLPLAALTSSHMSTYGQMDVSLDTYPYGGTTTTCESLWMGVPVVSLAGTSHAQNVGRSLLGAMGLGHLVCVDEDAYVATAVDLVQDLPALATIRASLRDRMAQSTLCNGKSFVEQLEHEYAKMAARWAEENKDAPADRDCE